MARHPHADLMIAYANDDTLEIQVRLHEFGIWQSIRNPNWDAEFQYRIKPQPKKNVEMWQWVCRTGYGAIVLTNTFFPNAAEAQGKIDPTHKVVGKAEWTRIEIDEA
jgi:hypothetical protein